MADKERIKELEAQLAEAKRTVVISKKAVAERCSISVFQGQWTATLAYTGIQATCDSAESAVEDLIDGYFTFVAEAAGLKVEVVE